MDIEILTQQALNHVHTTKERGGPIAIKINLEKEYDKVN